MPSEGPVIGPVAGITSIPDDYEGVQTVLQFPFTEPVVSVADEESLTIGRNVNVYIDDRLQNSAFELLQDGSTTGQVLFGTHRRFGSETDVHIEIDAVQGTQTGGTLSSITQSVRVYNHTINTTADRHAVDTPELVALWIENTHLKNIDLIDEQSFRILDTDGGVIETVQTGVGSQIAIVDMSEYATGVYTIIPENGAETTVVVHDLGLKITTDRQTATIGGTLRGHVAATVKTPRVVTVTLVNESNVQMSETTTTITTNGTGRFRINTTAISDIDAGTYTLLVTDTQTDIQTASNPIRVLSSSAGEGFTRAIYTDARGDIVEIPLKIGQGRTATVTIGNNSSDIQAIVTVQDRTEDGTVTLRFNTDAMITHALSGSNESEDSVFAVKNDSMYERLSANSHDTLLVANLTVSMAEDAVPLSEGQYRISIEGTANTSFPSDTAMIRIKPPTIETLQVYTAPMGATFTTVEEITDAVEDEQITPTEVVAMGDIIIYAVTAEGFAGRIEQSEKLTLQTFDRTLAEHASRYQTPSVSITYTETATTPGSDQLNNAWVVSDTSNHSYYIGATAGTLIDTATEDIPNQSAGTHLTATLLPGTRGDDSYLSNFTTIDNDRTNTSVVSSVGKAQIGTDDGWTVRTGLVPRQVEFDTNLIPVAALSDQHITGTTTVAPGSVIRTVLRANISEKQTEINQPINETVHATVGINQTWSSVFDFSVFDTGEPFMIHSMVSPANVSMTQNRMHGHVGGSPAADEIAVAGEKTGAAGGGGSGNGIAGIITGLFDGSDSKVNVGTETTDISETDTLQDEATAGERESHDGTIVGSFADTELGQVVENTVQSSPLTRLMQPVAVGFMILLSVVSLLLYRRR
ncbi:hypothetical protein [Haloquadratum walsbyi]|uniref:DUF7827 domain-containing protein n=1 Tax=Haloquadratum walsbyi J07HQW2 TaxID=1238425 RepID=U1N0U8_9EURY|nr:hypothetical protein [Haloquadratum walsbyi]ERG96444.1 MAG: hypothetical protein J07HQW2_02923 [Haloquadratum walsbyi J07HQW2]